MAGQEEMREREREREREEGEREERDSYLDTRSDWPPLSFPGFNALFYTKCPGVTRGRNSLQYDRLWTKIDRFSELALSARVNPIKMILWYLSWLFITKAMTFGGK